MTSNIEEIYEEIDKEEEVLIPKARVPSKALKSYNFVNERQVWIQDTADMLGVPFRTVLFKTIDWPTEWIRDHYLQCKKPEVENPARMWWGLIKYQKKEALKNK